MNKKSITTFLLIGILVLGIASPTFAQQGSTPGAEGGFFGMMSQFFSRIFHPGSQNATPQGGEEVNPSETPSGMPSEEPNPTEGENRLQGLVTAGKITQAQEQEIMTEVNKIRTEILSWSASTGINPVYIYGGLRGPGMGVGIGPTGFMGRPMPAVSVTPGEFEGGHPGQLPSGQGIMAPRAVAQ